MAPAVAPAWIELTLQGGFAIAVRGQPAQWAALAEACNPANLEAQGADTIQFILGGEHGPVRIKYGEGWVELTFTASAGAALTQRWLLAMDCAGRFREAAELLYGAAEPLHGEDPHLPE